MRAAILFGLATIAALIPLAVGAHEVYVLTPAQIAHDLATPSPNPFDSYDANRYLFFISGFLAFVVVTTVFFASITHRFEVMFEPYLTRMRPWAALVARITLGVCLIASALNAALFGPELPLADFGAYAPTLHALLFASGGLILAGLGTRYAAVAALFAFAGGVAIYGTYMLNYANYAGEMLVVLLLGSGTYALDNLMLRAKPIAWVEALEPYAFLFLRIGFGVSVAFAAIYAKFIHSNLALSTISEYNLTAFFPFETLFIVLGACIIEALMGIFFIIGFEVRHTALFFLFWIFLSLIYFGESVWPHLVLVGVNIALFFYGYDRLTIQGRIFNKGRLQPFL